MGPPDNHPIVDLHCHPSLKPFGLACPGNINSSDASLPNSIWYNDPPTRRDIRLNKFPCLTRFKQSSFTDLYQGKSKVVVIALNPIEKGFFINNLGTGKLSDDLAVIVTMIAKKKIDFIQNLCNDYFKELNAEYSFYRQLDGTKLTLYGDDVCYKLTKDYNDVVANLGDPAIVSVILSIEGANSLIDTIDNPQENSILSNIDKIKNWPHPPLFIALAHHFYHGFAGHAESFPDFIACIADQSQNINTGITSLGEKGIHRLLSKSNGRRIYIDIKHLSCKSRLAYYRLLKEVYPDEDIPLIVSHGAVNGYKQILEGPTDLYKERNGMFNGKDINFYDDEIETIARSGGIFGLQLDKCHVTNKHNKWKIKRLCFSKYKRKQKWTRMLWNQIEHIADVLDSKGLDAWNITAIGSDFDGITDPLEGYWTSAELPELRSNLFDHAKLYLATRNFLLPSNRKTPDEVLDQIFRGNAMNFFMKYY